MTFTNTCNDTCEKCCIRKNHDDGGDIDEVDDIAHHIHATIETDISIDAAADDSYSLAMILVIILLINPTEENMEGIDDIMNKFYGVHFHIFNT